MERQPLAFLMVRQADRHNSGQKRSYGTISAPLQITLYSFDALHLGTVGREGSIPFKQFTAARSSGSCKERQIQEVSG